VRERLTSLPWDWYAGAIPDNVWIDATAYVETSFSFLHMRSRLATAIDVGRGASLYIGNMFDVGPEGRVTVGDYTLLNGARIVCDRQVSFGPHCLVSWNVVVMDTYRMPIDPGERREAMRGGWHPAHPWRDACAEARPVSVGANVWIGFDACILPGVTIGDGAVVGARSVVASDVPPYAVVAGNPARLIRMLTPEAPEEAHP
jgi:acetyltransferase-like isoleucine patch superfamily enzyme